jgi:hypothetical protein
MSRREGRRRFGLLFGAASGGLCGAMMAVVLIVYGAPYNRLWWFVMAAILVAACFIPRLLVRPLEWVFEGYRDE